MLCFVVYVNMCVCFGACFVQISKSDFLMQQNALFFALFI